MKKAVIIGVGAKQGLGSQLGCRPALISKDHPHPLLKLDNVTITPHLGTASAQTRQRMNEISVENLLRGVRGEPLLFEVNPASG